MAATAALNVVRQIQALADGPDTPEMKGCLGQIVSSLQFFLEHPDSRVRITAARTLLKLKRGYSDAVAALDLSRVETVFSRCEEAQQSGTATADSEELHQILAAIRGDDEPRSTSNGPASGSVTPAPAPTPGPSTSSGGPAPGKDRGEVVLKVGEESDAKVKAKILEKVVALGGVMSVTFEGAHVIVGTRELETAVDAGFLADLLTAVKAQGLHGVSLVNAGGAVTNAAAPADASSNVEATITAEMSAVAGDGDEAGEPGYLDDEEDGLTRASAADGGDSSYGGAGVGHSWARSTSPGAGMPYAGAGGFGGYHAGGSGLSAGLGAGGGSAMGGPQWSFFSQNNWMTGRRVQQFDDDPTIAARLAKAKLRQEQRKKEEQSRLGRLFSAISGSKR